MATRPTWKGVLKVSLVTMPIKVFPATSTSEALSFNQLHDVCQSRIQQKKWCPTCEREVPTSEIVKGYEFEKGRYVIIRPEEFDAVQPPSTRVIDLVTFADAATLEPLYVDRAYYLAPDGPTAGEAYAVLRDAMNGKVGIGKLALYGREYLVAVRPQLYVLMLYTLHHAGEIRPLEEIDALADIPAFVSAAELKLARQVVAACSGPLALDDFTDAYRADLQRLIAAKIAGDEIVLAPPLAAPPLLELHDALTRSLALTNARTRIVRGTPVKRRRA